MGPEFLQTTSAGSKRCICKLVRLPSASPMLEAGRAVLRSLSNSAAVLVCLQITLEGQWESLNGVLGWLPSADRKAPIG